MGLLTDKIGIAIYNAGVRKRNQIVRDIHDPVKRKALTHKAVNYVHAVGTNIVNDVSTGQSQMFPFQIPHERESKRVRQIRRERERIEQHRPRNRRKHR